MSDRPYPCTKERIEKSPFRTVENAKKYLNLYKDGHPIGFTMTASLKSLGLIPRSNGRYVLGPKYQT